MMVRAHIIYSGKVQGVGFRFTVQRCAISLGLNGWVRNKNDGTVEISVQGHKEDIKKLCVGINEHFHGYIGKWNVDYRPEAVMADGFHIEP